MVLKAMFVCDTLRLEVGGKLTAVGIYNDQVFVGPGEGPIVLPMLAFVAILQELTDVTELKHRFGVDLESRQETMELSPFSQERHHPEADEHNFVMERSPMVFATPGAYVFRLDVDAGMRSASFRSRFVITRRA